MSNSGTVRPQHKHSNCSRYYTCKCLNTAGISHVLLKCFDKSNFGFKHFYLKYAHLDGRYLREAGQVLRISDGGDEFDGTNYGAGRAAVCVGTGHAGAGRTRGTGVMQGRHWKGASVSGVGMLRKDREREKNGGEVTHKKRKKVKQDIRKNKWEEKKGWEH